MGMGCMMGCSGGSSTTIDPPAGAAFKDPATMPNLSATPGVVEVNLEAKIAPVNINGTVANLMTYNGSYPAPTIKVAKGDILKVHFKNSLPFTGYNVHGHETDATNLHTHGLHVSPSGNADNAMLRFTSGDTFDYEYNLGLHPAGNLNYYHPHSHGTTAEQVWGGMAGALEVADPNTALSGYETHTMVLKDIDLSGSAPAPHDTMDDYMNGLEGNTVMVNGQVNPVLTMKPGQVQRWRFVNASNARFYKLSLTGHNLNIIGTDGGLLDKPYAKSYMLLSPGERLDVLVKVSSTKADYKLKALPYSRGGGTATNQTVTLLTARVTGSVLTQSLPTTINSAAVRMATPANIPTRSLTLSMDMMMGGMMGGGMGGAYINGIAFSDTSAYTLQSNLGGYEIWNISNMSMMDHPFHHHVNAAQVLSISGGDTAYSAFYTGVPALKDTVVVPAMGSVRLLMPVKDYGGLTMFHCHILEHEDIGMMGLWDIR